MIRRRPTRRSAATGPGEGGEARGVRLQRVLAAAGVAARRTCEEMIEAGRVEVNGKVVQRLPVFVDPSRDAISVDGRPLPRVRSRRGGEPDHAELAGQRALYILVHKPEKVLCTTRDEGGRKTILDMVHHPAVQRGPAAEGGGGGGGGSARLYPVGRLDFHMSGLVLLTNDGRLAHRLTHASFGVRKTYRVTLRSILDDDFLRALRDGLNKKHTRAVQEARPDRATGAGSQAIDLRPISREGGKTIIEVSLAERGPRSLADMLGEAGMKVAKLVRTGLGPLELRGVGLGQWRELERDEIRALKRAGTGGARGRAKPAAR